MIKQWIYFDLILCAQSINHSAYSSKTIGPRKQVDGRFSGAKICELGLKRWIKFLPQGKSRWEDTEKHPRHREQHLREHGSRERPEKRKSLLRMEIRQIHLASAFQVYGFIPVSSASPLGSVDTPPPTTPQLEAPGGQGSRSSNHFKPPSCTWPGTQLTDIVRPHCPLGDSSSEAEIVQPPQGL